MSRRGGLVALLLLLCGIVASPPGGDRARAEAAPVFDQALAASVFATALTFMVPRILDPEPVRTLVAWGLGGVAALDPALDATVEGNALLLLRDGVAVWRIQAPAGPDPSAWAGAAAALCAEAARRSATVRDAGAGALVQSFFDELFNHLDPYSRYVAPAPATVDRDRREGGEAGIGAVLLARPGGLALGALAPDGPAAAAGLADGDRVLAIDGAPLDVADLADAQALLAGAAGSTVTLRIRRGHGRARDVALGRAVVPPETVFGTSTDGLLVLKVTGFARDTAEELSAVLDAGLRDHPHGLVLDLRGNRGGLLQQAVTAAALVLDNGVAVITEGRYPQANHVWSVQGGDVTDGLPIVVLVDGRTASAAEILAAALADHRRAVVAGSVTLGKGLVQTLLPLPDGGELFVTWSRVLAPLGWPIQGLGVLPQLCTSRGAAALDDQMRALDNGATPLAAAISAERASRAPLPIARILELRDACPAAIGTDEDDEAARALLADAPAYRAALAAVPPLD